MLLQIARRVSSSPADGLMGIAFDGVICSARDEKRHYGFIFWQSPPKRSLLRGRGAGGGGYGTDTVDLNFKTF